jgi:hypothetical protein
VPEPVHRFDHPREGHEFTRAANRENVRAL